MFTKIVAGITVLAGIMVAGLVAAPSTHAQTKNEPKKDTQVTSTKEQTYTYTAQPSDSYSVMARKAVQTYGKKYKQNITQAGILFAETNMTLQAQSPFLTTGQKVVFKESVVKDWFTKAQKLTSAQQSAWAAYLPGVDFNTNAVGESR